MSSAGFVMRVDRETRDVRGIISGAGCLQCFRSSGAYPHFLSVQSSLAALPWSMPRPCIEEAYPVRTPRTRRCSSHEKPSTPPDGCSNRKSKKSYFTLHRTQFNRPFPIPCRTLFEPKMTPSQCMQNATARFSAPSPGLPIQPVYRFGRCHRAVVSSPPFTQPTQDI